jgi:hypothetical protein
MTTSTKMQMSSLVSRMSTCQQKELNVVGKNACNYFCPMWKPIRSMGCVHTHRKIPAIEGCDNPNRVQNVLEKIERQKKLIKF